MLTNRKTLLRKRATQEGTHFKGKQVECYKCKEKGHMGPEKPGAHVIKAKQDQKPNDEADPWMRTVSVGSEAEVEEVL